MLTNTFCHIRGIGQGTEQRLWQAGIPDWETALTAPTLPLSAARTATLKAAVAESATRLEAGDLDYFTGSLATAEHWRLFPQARGPVAFLDIETTGLAAGVDHVTTICVYDGSDVHHYVHGQNLDEFGRDMERYGLIVTFNGKTFDLPFIRTALGVTIDQPHIDLRYVLASCGYRGGLKNCEKLLGLDRKDLADVDGFFAVLLWKDYARQGNAKALDTLLAYNALDVINLHTLMALAYNMNLAKTPFAGTLELPVPVPIDPPFQADTATIQRLQAGRMPGWW